MGTLSNILGMKDTGIGGTGKRASYAMLSYNTSSGQGGIVFYDEDFNPALSYSDMGNYNVSGNLTNLYFASSSMLNYASLFNGAQSTSNVPSSNATSNFLNSTNASGQFGNSMIDVFSDATFQQNSRSSNSWNNKFILNRNVIDSNQSNKRLEYLLFSGVIRAVDLLNGAFNFRLNNTSDYTITGLDANMVGSASYNLSRKEMVVLSYSASGGSFNVITFQNLDLDKYPDPSVAFARPEVVRVNSTVSFSTSWSVSNNESNYNVKPFLCDSGLLYVTVMFPSSAYRLYSFSRSGTNLVNATLVTSINLTTSYGQEQGSSYGQKKITSRDGTSVVAFCPYYYYGSGIASYLINKSSASYTTYSSTDTSIGFQVVPYKDNGWAFFYAGNGYASNYTGNYIAAIYLKSTAASGFSQIGSTKYFIQFPLPNTTNYPAFTQVTDYDLLTPNYGGAK